MADLEVWVEGVVVLPSLAPASWFHRASCVVGVGLEEGLVELVLGAGLVVGLGGASPVEAFLG